MPRPDRWSALELGSESSCAQCPALVVVHLGAHQLSTSPGVGCSCEPRPGHLLLLGSAGPAGWGQLGRLCSRTAGRLALPFPQARPRSSPLGASLLTPAPPARELPALCPLPFCPCRPPRPAAGELFSSLALHHRRGQVSFCEGGPRLSCSYTVPGPKPVLYPNLSGVFPGDLVGFQEGAGAARSLGVKWSQSEPRA